MIGVLVVLMLIGMLISQQGRVDDAEHQLSTNVALLDSLRLSAISVGSNTSDLLAQQGRINAIEQQIASLDRRVTILETRGSQ